MSADFLLTHFDRLAAEPGAIPKLRRLVLDLAVRGKLVPQDPEDEPVSDRSPVEEAPFEVPTAWHWGTIGDQARVYAGDSASAGVRAELADVTEGHPFISTKDVGYGFDKLDYENGLLVATGDTRFKVAPAGTVFICAEGGSAGRKCGIADRQVSFGNKLIAAEAANSLEPQFLLIWYQTEASYDEFRTRMTGVIGGISQKNFKALPVPLPPLAEQRRIVARVDELMARLDALEAAQDAREAARERFTSASQARLATPDPDPETFKAHAGAALASFAHLTTRPAQVEILRQTILSLAVRGKLVEPDWADEAVSGLVEMIRLERRVTGKHSVQPDMTLVDFSPPSHWEWQSLGAVLTDGPQNGLSPRKTERTDAPKAITLTATTSGNFDARHFKHVDVSVTEAARYWLEPGDLLFQRGNTREYVGMAAIYTGPPEEFLFPDLIMRVKISSHVDIRYVHNWCISPFARQFLSTNAAGAQQTMPKINQGILRSLPIPLPPLAEQRRIVEKVDRLMALCDRLERALSEAETTSAKLLDAAIRDALQPSAEAMEAAE